MTGAALLRCDTACLLLVPCCPCLSKQCKNYMDDASGETMMQLVYSGVRAMEAAGECLPNERTKQATGRREPSKG